MSDYLQTVEDVYAEAAKNPDADLCCTQAPVWRLPDLVVPQSMLEMNYGCGSTVSPRDLRTGDAILYVGVGGGLEALQFAYFTRRIGSVIAVDPVAAMRDRARANFIEAARSNAWFRPDFVTLLDGSALELPVADASVSILAQNCLFNVFRRDDLDRALGQVFRVLKMGGAFFTSDPITPIPLPPELAADERLRARCLSGCLTYDEYIGSLTKAGFGKIEVRNRFPYRYLDSKEHPALAAPVMLESIEVAAYKVPDGADGPAIFSGQTVTYSGGEDIFDDGSGHRLRRGIPMQVSDAAACRLGKRANIVITAPTYHSQGGGCC